ncbi:MAG: hypothetical protein WCK29_00610 [archaeon]
MEVLLDSNFVISSMRKKIDFITELENLGFKVLLPREVFQELKDLRTSSTPADKSAIELALKLFETRKTKKTTLGNQNVDLGLIEKGRKGAYIATLDNAIKREVDNKVVIDASSNNVSIERN